MEIKEFLSSSLAFNYVCSYLQRNSGNLILSGGSSVKSLITTKIKDFSFSNRKILLSDERLVKKKSKLRNDKFFYNLIKNRYIKKENFLNYKKKNYDKEYIQLFSKKIKNINFKIAIMGLGSNGHIASIFDNRYHGNQIFYNITTSPKRPKNRVTISINKLKKTNKIFLLANKRTKKNEIKNFKENIIIKKLKDKIELIVFS